MKLRLCAVGRLPGRSEERALVDDYAKRLVDTGRRVGLAAFEEHEVDGRKHAGMAAESDALRALIPPGYATVMLDERGRTMTSPDFAGRLAGYRDAARDVAFVIGGADGLDPGLRAEADLLLSFGPMVWPHALARAMLAEQLYRAASILAGTPYHRS